MCGIAVHACRICETDLDWEGECSTVSELLNVFLELQPEALRIRLNHSNAEHQALVEMTFAHPYFRIPRTRALYLRGMRSLGFLGQMFYEKNKNAHFRPQLQEVDISFNNSTPCGESVYKTLLPSLHDDLQLRVLRIRYGELNYDVGAQLVHGVTELLRFNHRLQIVDMDGVRNASGQIVMPAIPEENTTILWLGQQRCRNERLERNQFLYVTHAFQKRVIRQLVRRHRLDFGAMTYMCRFLMPHYSNHSYSMPLVAFIQAQGPFLSVPRIDEEKPRIDEDKEKPRIEKGKEKPKTQRTTQTKDLIYPRVYHPDAKEEDHNSYNAFLARSRSNDAKTASVKKAGASEEFLQQRMRFLELQQLARRQTMNPHNNV